MTKCNNTIESEVRYDVIEFDAFSIVFIVTIIFVKIVLNESYNSTLF